MRKMIFSQEVEPREKTAKRFALFPVIVGEAHPTHDNDWLIWLEWYEIYRGKKWLLEKNGIKLKNN